MKRKGMVYGILLFIFGSLLVVGCDFHEGEELSYEILPFEEAPKTLRDSITETHGMILEDESRAGTLATGSVNFGNDGRYEYFITADNETFEVVEVVPNEALGTGLEILFTIEEHEETVEFPRNVMIVKFNEYHERIVHSYVSSPRE